MDKYHIKLKDINDGKEVEIYNEIFNEKNGIARISIDRNWEIVYTRRFTGRKDCEGNDLYDKDIVEFDRREWGGNDNIHLVEWDNKESEWSWGGGSASDMGWRTKIGNLYDNPELLKNE